MYSVKYVSLWIWPCESNAGQTDNRRQCPCSYDIYIYIYIYISSLIHVISDTSSSAVFLLLVAPPDFDARRFDARACSVSWLGACPVTITGGVTAASAQVRSGWHVRMPTLSRYITVHVSIISVSSVSAQDLSRDKWPWKLAHWISYHGTLIQLLWCTDTVTMAYWISCHGTLNQLHSTLRLT